jgi:hypothetical protein
MIRRSSSQDSLSSDEGHVLKVRIGPATRTSEDRGDSVRVSRIPNDLMGGVLGRPWSTRLAPPIPRMPDLGMTLDQLNLWTLNQR